MRHFSSERWADFVRKLLNSKDMQEMQTHLQAGCPQCRGDLAAWTRVNDAARREAAYEPPAAAVRMAKAAMKLHGQPERTPVAKLLFDSLRAPALAGVRAASVSPARQLLYGFDEYRVDVRFEPNFDADQVMLVGQILNTGDSVENPGPISVALMRGGQVLGTAKTNEFGEFQLECDLGGRLELQLTLPQGDTVKVPMVEPMPPDEQAGGSKLSVNRRLTPKKKAGAKSTRKKV